MGSRLFSLRLKLALVSVLLLTIPAIGFWYAAQMQAYLMSAEEQALTLTAKAVSTILHGRPDLFETNILRSFDEQKELQAFLLKNPVSLDGFTDDWVGLLGEAKYYDFNNVLENYGTHDEGTLNFRHIIAQRGNFYYALFIVNDDSIVFRDHAYAGLNKSDHLQIAVQGQYEGQHDLYFMSPFKSGTLNGHLMRKDPLNFVPERYEPDIFGYWRKTAKGYNIEIRLPVAMVKNGRISFAIADVDDPVTKKLNIVVGTSGTKHSGDLAFLLIRSPMLENIISSLHSPSARIRVIDSRLRQRASVGQVFGEQDSLKFDKKLSPSWKNLLKPVYTFFSDRYIVEIPPKPPKYLSKIEEPDLKSAIRKGKPFTLRRSLPDSDAAILAAGEPIKYGDKVIGTVLVEQATNNILAEKNRIIARTIDITLLVFIIGGIALFAFASRLSSRIRQLAMQTEKAIGENGRIRESFKASEAKDELGDLSRRFAGMLNQLQAYNLYQEKMADNLEHEIRTPIAGISANLSNLEKINISRDVEVNNHLSGIRENVRRIDSMMTSIREATSLEDALKVAEKTNFDLKEALVVWVKDGYRQMFPENSFVLKFPEQPLAVNGDPVRIRQMFDKLIENAVDFSKTELPITVDLNVENRLALIRVINEGPELPSELQGQIFDSMVSIRKKSEKKSHLGLGLYVAKQIAEFHGGSIQAANRDEGVKGVVFKVIIPLL